MLRITALYVVLRSSIARLVSSFHSGTLVTSLGSPLVARSLRGADFLNNVRHTITGSVDSS